MGGDANRDVRISPGYPAGYVRSRIKKPSVRAGPAVGCAFRNRRYERRQLLGIGRDNDQAFVRWAVFDLKQPFDGAPIPWVTP